MCEVSTRPLWQMDEQEQEELLRSSWRDDQVEEAIMIADLERKRRVDNNRKRAFNMSRSVKQNQLSYERISEYLRTTDRQLTDEEIICLTSYRRSIQVCCQYSLWREHEDEAYEFIAAHTCKHKYCNVCNARRCKEIRKRYRLLFQKDESLLQDYDFMHLTLTVPHTASGWMGKTWYAEDLMKKFNLMRKRSWWKSMVYAGEFGVECTKGDEGLHIHIHSLLLVRKEQGNRNDLHRNVLIEWNKLTTWSGTNRKKIEEEAKQSILKSNKTLTPMDVAMLSPEGATMIGLETVYLKSEYKQLGYGWHEASGSYIKRINYNRDGHEAYMNAIMETIKYHFEPSAIHNDGSADIDLMLDILPSIKGKPLYRKFGAFHAGTKDAHEYAKLLNYNSKLDDYEALEAEHELSAHDVVIHPETGEVVENDRYQYLIIPMQSVWFNASQDYRPRISGRAKRNYLPEGWSIKQVYEEMTRRSTERRMSLKIAESKSNYLTKTG